MGKVPFLAGVFVGRILRFSLVGFLAARYGDQAAQVLKSHYPMIFLVLVGVLILIFLIRYLRNRLHQAEI